MAGTGESTAAGLCCLILGLRSSMITSLKHARYYIQLSLYMCVSLSLSLSLSLFLSLSLSLSLFLSLSRCMYVCAPPEAWSDLHSPAAHP